MNSEPMFSARTSFANLRKSDASGRRARGAVASAGALSLIGVLALSAGFARAADIEPKTHTAKAGDANVEYCGSGDVEVADADITTLAVVLPGTSSGACESAKSIINAASATGHGQSTLVVAPALSVSDEAGSAVATDALIRATIKSAKFANLHNVIVAGHGAAGEFVNRYAAASTITSASSAVKFHFVVANASSYLYMSDERMFDGTLRVPTDEEKATCPTYDNYKFGLEKRSGYSANLDAAGLKKTFASRHISYLVAASDSDAADTADGSTACAYALQGATIAQRGANYMAHLQKTFGAGISSTHEMHQVSGASGENAVFNSSVGRSELFGGISTSTTTAAPTTVVPTTIAPTTVVPTTVPDSTTPTTASPSTTIPATVPPTDSTTPTTEAPATTTVPTTVAPATTVVNRPPTTMRPRPRPRPTTTQVPATSAPTTAAPVTSAPTTAAPTTSAPTTSAPSTKPGNGNGNGNGSSVSTKDLLDRITGASNRNHESGANDAKANPATTTPATTATPPAPAQTASKDAVSTLGIVNGNAAAPTGTAAPASGDAAQTAGTATTANSTASANGANTNAAANKGANTSAPTTAAPAGDQETAAGPVANDKPHTTKLFGISFAKVGHLVPVIIGLVVLLILIIGIGSLLKRGSKPETTA